MFPAAPNVSPAVAPNRTLVLTTKVTDKTELCTAFPRAIAFWTLYFSLKAENSFKSPGQETEPFSLLGLEVPSQSSFDPDAQLHKSVPSQSLFPLAVVSAILLTSLAFCQVMSRRTGQTVHPHPFQPAGSLVSSLDTKTNRLCALAPYSIQGVGGATNIPAMWTIGGISDNIFDLL